MNESLFITYSLSKTIVSLAVDLYIQLRNGFANEGCDLSNRDSRFILVVGLYAKLVLVVAGSFYLSNNNSLVVG